jgi:predicted nucleic acid-binding protein
MRCFLNANVVISSLQWADPADLEQTRKQRVATELIDRLDQANAVVISTQVLGEFFNAITRKGVRPLTAAEGASAVELLAKFPVVSTDVNLVRAAIQRSQTSKISFYDALIVEAAIRAGASILYTEDLHHGIQYGTSKCAIRFCPERTNAHRTL